MGNGIGNEWWIGTRLAGYDDEGPWDASYQVLGRSK